MAKDPNAKEPKIKEIAECRCGATLFQGPSDTVEIVNGNIVVKERALRCLRCHNEYLLADALALPARRVELPA